MSRSRRGPASIAVFVLTTLAVGAAGTGWGVHRLDQIDHVELAGSLGRPASGVNYLIVGSDSRAGADPDDPDFGAIGDEVTGRRSDTMMILHVDGTSAQILSLPRDLLVEMADRGDDQRINVAYTRGPEVLVRTIQANFAIPVTHYLEIDFVGFKDLVDALGGVELCLPTAMTDETTGFNFAVPGCHVIDGVQALGWARSRHLKIFNGTEFVEDPTGDLGRVTRQQEFMRRAVVRVAEVGARDPLALGRAIEALTERLVVDDAMGRKDLVNLAGRLQAIGGGKIASATYPGTGRTVDGAAVLIPNHEAAAEIAAPFR
jgi:LCP family protein required for cell wall assembly